MGLSYGIGIGFHVDGINVVLAYATGVGFLHLGGINIDLTHGIDTSVVFRFGLVFWEFSSSTPTEAGSRS